MFNYLKHERMLKYLSFERSRITERRLNAALWRWKYGELVKWWWRGNNARRWECMFHCCCVRHKPHTDWSGIEPEPPQWQECIIDKYNPHSFYIGAKLGFNSVDLSAPWITFCTSVLIHSVPLHDVYYVWCAISATWTIRLTVSELVNSHQYVTPIIYNLRY